MLGNLWDLFDHKKPSTIAVRFDLETLHKLEVLVDYYQKSKQEIIMALVLNEKRKPEEARVPIDQTVISRKDFQNKVRRYIFRVTSDVRESFDVLLEQGKSRRNSIYIKSLIDYEYKIIMRENDGI